MDKEEILSRLYDYQIDHVRNLYNAVNSGHCLDLSDTGTGKTFCAIAVAKLLKLMPVVICPKVIKNDWQEVFEIFDIEGYVNNIEQYKICNTPACNWDEEKHIFSWNLDRNKLLIIDEAHVLKNNKTKNSQLIHDLLDQNITNILFLSATIAESPLNMGVFGRAIGLFRKEAFYGWLGKMGVEYTNITRDIFDYKFTGTRDHILQLHEQMKSTNRAFRMKKECNSHFKRSNIITTPITVSQKDQIIIDKEYRKIQTIKGRLQNIGESVDGNIEIIYARKAVEAAKLSYIYTLTKNLLQEKNNVVVFLNFKQSIIEFSKLLNEKTLNKNKINYAVITGAVKQSDRVSFIKDFQDNKIQVLVMTTGAGGQSISLHDINGKRARYSLISPNFNAVELKQALGRVDRAGSKSVSNQRIIYVKDTIEEVVSRKLRNKIYNINAINDGDLC